jgi:CheY-like chemotaxis protein
MNKSGNNVSKYENGPASPSLNMGTIVDVTPPLAQVPTSAVFPYPILVVEDNMLNMKIIRTFLQRKLIPHEVAENGQIALEIVEKRMGDILQRMETQTLTEQIPLHLLPFRMILMDVQMPVMDGFKCTTEIRKHEKNTWVKQYNRILNAQKGQHIGIPGGVVTPIVAMTGLAAQEVYL